jgi:hypothetical protein
MSEPQVHPLSGADPDRAVGITLTYAEWLAEGERRFGPDQMTWRFVCPVCGHVAAVSDWKAAGAPENSVGGSCVGRWIPGSRKAFGGKGAGPCNYAGFGLFRLNPVTVQREDGGENQMFRFAEVTHG